MNRAPGLPPGKDAQRWGAVSLQGTVPAKHIRNKNNPTTTTLLLASFGTGLIDLLTYTGLPPFPTKRQGRQDARGERGGGWREPRRSGGGLGVELGARPAAPAK